MLVDAKSLAVHAVCAAEQGRYSIDCVRLEPDGTTVATDGWMLLAVEPNPQDAGDYPDLVPPAEIPKAGICIPGDVAKEATHNMPKNGSKPILRNALVTVAELPSGVGTSDSKPGKIELTTTDLRRNRKIGGEVPNVQFPRWKEMVPAPRDKAVTVTLGLPLLEKLVKTLKAVQNPESSAVTFEVEDAEKLIVVSGSAGPGRRFLGVIAPVKVRMASEPNDWETALRTGD